MPHTGLQPGGYFTPKLAVWKSLKRLHNGVPSKIELILSMERRNDEIGERYVNGESIPQLALVFDLSNARIHQILHCISITSNEPIDIMKSPGTTSQ